MEPRPLKRNIHIQPLSKDHHFSLLFCWKIRQGIKNGVDPVRIRSYVQYFWQQHMLPHFREEECILFLPVDHEKVAQAIQEHQQIKTAINKLQKTNTDNLNASLSTLADLVDKHVRSEERELFPFLESILSDQQLEEIGRKLSVEPSPADNYEDEFWLKK